MRIPLAAIGLLLAASACSSEPEQTSVRNDAEQIAATLEAKADNLEALADSTANADAAAMLEGAADNVETQADNVRDAAETR
ncbi:hypothetical protein ASG29_13185 [Sphingomonas sp. Leaf412]|uniref:hypothetical protein n=1 Tax=Sphingomonas sp. Leaf412 TaxID=1736370 RepID=UPI0006F3F468|nr:hypothetical protein [Sphingomonas sp. Leaf412]KQT32683.1 hypothetical protein ASG29_13185 [Sphingomonas sp. Leaf412]